MAVVTARQKINNEINQRSLGLWRSVMVGVVALSLAGCAMGGVSIESAVPDTSIVTGSIRPSASADADAGKISDQSAIKNIVSALNFTQWGKNPVPWANPDTGSQGTITTIAESKSNDQLCRKFETSREAFDGVSIYRGETCMERGGNWTVTSFAPI